jgi:hypothetical protein
MAAAEKKLLRHWIYVLPDDDLVPRAYAWQERKTAQGKWYRVIETPAGDSQSEGLRQVSNDDVLYILASSVGSIGNPGDLVAHLIEHGLDRGHCVVKIFASHSGDSGVTAGSPQKSYAEKLYEAMRLEYPAVVVYGYLGEVTPDGFSGHKSAGLKPGETLEGLSEAEWNRRRLRAKENRVRFPPGPLGE